MKYPSRTCWPGTRSFPRSLRRGAEGPFGNRRGPGIGRVLWTSSKARSRRLLMGGEEKDNFSSWNEFSEDLLGLTWEILLFGRQSEFPGINRRGFGILSLEMVVG